MGKDSKMNNNNKIIIGADVDVKEALKKLTELEKKVKSLREIPSAQNLKTFGDEQKSKRFEDFRQRAQSDYAKQSLRIQKDIEKNLDIYYVKEKALYNLKEKGLINENKYLERKLQINNQIYEIEEKLSRITSTKDTPTSKGPGGLESFSKGIGAVTTALLSVTKAADFVNRQIPTYRAERSASLAEKTYESSYQAMRGDSFRNLMFAQERQAALKDTGAFGQNQKGINQVLGMGAGLGGTALLGAGLAGLLTGGLALPAIGIAAGAGLLSTKGGMGFESITGNFGEIDKMTGVQMMDYFKKRTAAEEAKDMQGTLTKDFLTENRGELIQGLRQSGMQEQDFMKNYVQGSALLGGKDFTFADKFRASQQILGAGGGSEAAFGQNAILALQAQRGMGVSNAGQIIGGLSSYQGATGGAQAFEEMMERGVTRGLDKSKYREEHRTYLTQVTEMARQIAGGESVLSASVLAGMGDNTTQRGVEIAAEQTKGLFDTLSQSGGVIGAMKMRGIAQSDTFKNIQGIDRVLLSRMRIEDIDAENEELKQFYEKSGTDKTVKDFAKELRGIYRKSEVGAYGATEEGKKLLQIYDKIEKGEATPEEMQEGTRLYSFFADQTGAYSKRKARFGATTGMEDFFSTEKAKQQQEEYEALNTKKYGGLLMGDVMGAPLAPEFLGRSLSEKEETRYVELEKTLAGMKGRPSDAMEGAKAGEGIMQSQVLGGEKMSEVMTDLAKSTTERLNMALSEQVNLIGFQKALEDKAGDLMAALISKWSGRGSPKPVPFQDTVTKNVTKPQIQPKQ
jgi:hypothetical protein